MYNLLFWIGVQLLLLWMLALWTEPYRNRKWFKVLFAPSAILEGLTRLIACCLSAKPVSQINFFEDHKPFLSDGKSKIPGFGAILFLVVWLGLFFVAFHAAAIRTEGLQPRILTLPHVSSLAMAQGIIQIDPRGYAAGLEAFFAATDWTSWQVWLLLYVFIGAFPFLAITFRQVQEGAALIFLLVLLTAVVNYFGLRPGFLSRGWYMYNWVLPEWFQVYSLFLTFIGLAFIPHFLARIAGRMVESWTDHRRSRRKTEASRPRDTAHSHA